MVKNKIKNTLALGILGLKGLTSVFAGGPDESVYDYSGLVNEEKIEIAESHTDAHSNLVNEIRGATDYGRNSGFEHQLVEEHNFDNLEKIATFEYVSQRPDFEDGVALGGQIHTYHIWNDGSVTEEGMNDVRFANRWFWDINGDGVFGAEEQEAFDNGYLIWMSDDFNAKANGAVKGLVSKMERKPEPEIIEREVEKIVYRNLPNSENNFNRIGFSLGGFGGVDPVRGGFGGVTAGINSYRKNLGVGLSGHFGVGMNKLLDELTTTPSSSGLYGHGTITQESMNVFGADLDLKVGGPISENMSLYGILGVGFDITKTTDKNLAEILKANDVLSSNTNYVFGSVITPTIRAGIEALHRKSGLSAALIGTYSPTNGRWSAGANVGYSFSTGEKRK